MNDDWARGEYTISMDRGRLDLDVIHGFLSETSYWAKGRSRERVERAIRHSLPFGLYHHPAESGAEQPGRNRATRGEQVGFARVVTDYVTFALLADVFVLEAHRGKGLGVWLTEVVTGFPELGSVRRWHLGTRDAHGLYRKLGFHEPTPDTYLDRLNPDSDLLR
jgi:GNAT superfamily N-acetyltransferase